MIRNWKLFLDSTNSDFDLAKDIFTELEDEFGLSIDYDNRIDDEMSCVMTLFGELEMGNNTEFTNFLCLLCHKVTELTNYICHFQLTFHSSDMNIPMRYRSKFVSFDGDNLSQSRTSDIGYSYFLDDDSRKKLNTDIFKRGTIWLYITE